MLTSLPPPPPLAEMLAEGPLALFLDFDGTLVPIAATPDEIAVPEGLNAALHRLNQRLAGRLALISGRALNDIERHLGAVTIARAGSHGADIRHTDGSALGAPPQGFPRDVTQEMAAYVGSGPLVLERKNHGAAIHYRGRQDAEAQAREFAANLAGQHGLEVKHGKAVVELVRPGADKAGAVEAFMQDEVFAGARPVFIGDDVTDEDGFRAVNAVGGTGVLVGEMRTTLAACNLPGVTAVHKWLGLDL